MLFTWPKRASQPLLKLSSHLPVEISPLCPRGGDDEGREEEDVSGKGVGGGKLEIRAGV